MTMTNKGLRIEGRIHREVVRKSSAQANMQISSDDVELDTGCIWPRKNGAYNLYLVDLSLEKGGHSNTYKRVCTYGTLVGPDGSRSRKRSRADLQSIYLVRPEPHFLNNNTVQGKLYLRYPSGWGRHEQYSTKFKDAWPPGPAAIGADINSSYHAPGVKELAVRLYHSHATMDYMVFDLLKKNIHRASRRASGGISRRVQT